MSGTDWRALCEELLDEVTARPLLLDRDLVARARTALAQPEPEAVGPSDEEIMGLMSQQMHDDLAAAVRALAEQEGFDSTPAKGVMRIMLNRHVVDLARAALARYGHQPAPPAEGEVGELVEYLRNEADYQGISVKRPSTAEKLTRIADLLERQAAPVAVSERLPEAGDCLGRPTEDSDAGWCWTYSGALEVWRFQSVVFPRPYPEPPRVTLSPSVTHWLPFNALPLPSGEVQP